MRNRILTGLRTLLTAARINHYTRQVDTAKPKFSIEPRPTPSTAIQDRDDWMFEAEADFARQTDALSNEMSALADNLAGLRETLALVNGTAPFPVEATTQRPCAMVHHDADLFEGEVLAERAMQDTTIGGEGVLLFGDEPAYDDAQALHAA